MKYKIILFVVMLVNFCASAQEITKKQEKKIRLVQDYIELESYDQALEIALLLYHDLPEHDEVNFMVGICYKHLKKDPDYSLMYLQKAADKKYISAYYHLAELYHKSGNMMMSSKYLMKFSQHMASDVDYRKMKDLQSKINMVFNEREKPVRVKIRHLGRNVNSEFADYAAYFCSDEEQLYFTSKRPNSEGVEDDFGGSLEKIFTSSWKGQSWDSSKELKGEFFSDVHDAMAGITPYGDGLIVYKTNDNLTGGDLYLVNKKQGDWAEPSVLPSSLNSSFKESSACFSNDMQELYFSSDRPNGFGGLDIYRIKRLPNGKWSKAMNLGPEINTAKDEDSPFLSPDDDILYFSSNNKKSMGGYDVFYSKRESNWTWGEIHNMGIPINSPNDDVFFSVKSNGTDGFVSTIRDDSFGEHDIYAVELYLEYDWCIQKVFVLDNDDKPINSWVELVESDKNELVGLHNVTTREGKAVLLLAPEVDYDIVIKKDGEIVKVVPLRLPVEALKEVREMVLKIE